MWFLHIPSRVSIKHTRARTCARAHAQFGTMSYIITSNLLYYHDGDRWITRDWPSIMERWTSRRRGGRGVPLEQ